MMQGRKPKDLRFKLLNGTTTNNQNSLPQRGEAFVVGEVDKPEGLDELSSQEWDRLVKNLEPILSPASQGMLLVCVSAYSQMVSADRVIQEKGLTYETSGKAGLIIRMRPEVRIRDTARTAYHRALAELGASPVAHTRVRSLPANLQTELPGISRFFS